MKSLWLLLLLFAMHMARGGVPPIGEVRSLYGKAVSDEASCNRLMELLAPFNENNNPLYAGYRASAMMMMAKHVINPFSKMTYFRKGKKIMQQAIMSDAKNIELRFLRFNAQTHIPSFLGYDDNIESDRKFLEEAYPKIKDEHLKQFMWPYLMKSAYITGEQKQQMQLQG